MPDRGSLRSIKGARQKKRTFEEEVRASVAQVSANLETTEARFAKTMQQVANAININSAVMTAVESFLDKSSPGWDGGIREKMKRHREMMAERDTAYHAAEAQRAPEEDPAVRKNLAERLTQISRELGTEVQDGAIAMSLYLQAGEPECAEKVLAELRASGKEIPPALNEIFVKLEERVAEVKKSKRVLWVPGDPPHVLPSPPGR